MDLENLIKFISASQKDYRCNGDVKFRRGKFRRNKRFEDYTIQHFEDMRYGIRILSRSSDGARAVLFAIDEVSAEGELLLNDREDYLLKLEQALIGTKNHLRLTSPDGGGQLLFSYLSLALGNSFHMPIPKFFKCIKSAEAVNLIVAERLINGLDRNPVEDMDGCMRTAKGVLENLCGSDLIHAIARPGPDIEEDSESFCKRLCINVSIDILENIQYQLPFNPDLEQELMNFNQRDTPFSVAGIMKSSMPLIYHHLLNERHHDNFQFSSSLCPQMAFLANRVSKLWFRNIQFTVFTADNRAPHDTISLRMICSEHDDFIYGTENRRDLICKLTEQFKVEDCTIEEDYDCGVICLNPMLRTRPYRNRFHFIDRYLKLLKLLLNTPIIYSEHWLIKQRMNETNASKAIYEAYHPNEGDLGICEKKFSNNGKNAFGFFVIMCGCKDPSVLMVILLATGESSDIPMKAIQSRFPNPPEVIFYDNACHLFAYCMARDPLFFFGTIFLIDQLHWKNHIAACSCMNHPQTFKDNELVANCNTQACEVLFGRVRDKIAHRVASMGPYVALVFLFSYFLVHNVLGGKDRDPSL